MKKKGSHAADTTKLINSVSAKDDMCYFSIGKDQKKRGKLSVLGVAEFSLATATSMTVENWKFTFFRGVRKRICQFAGSPGPFSHGRTDFGIVFSI